MNPLTKNPASSVQKKAEVDFLVGGLYTLGLGLAAKKKIR